MTEPVVLGVDFGTSFTVAALRYGGRPPELVRFGDSVRLPSAVMALEDGTAVAGQRVLREGVKAPERVERTPKRELGQGAVVLGGALIPDTELVAAVFRYVAGEVRRLLNGHDPDEIVLSHPVQWAAGRLALLVKAAASVGWTRARLIPEPVAAAEALAWRGVLDDAEVGDLVAVYDLGGGTFDTALLERKETGFVVFGEPGGKDNLGGEDLDDALLHRLGAKLSEAEDVAWRDPDATDDPARWAQAAYQLRDEVRRAKEALAEGPTVELPLLPPFSARVLLLSRTELEATSRQLVDQTAAILEATLRRNGKLPQDVAAVCLAGGSSRLSMVTRVVHERLGIAIATWGDPKALTAEGATLIDPWAGTTSVLSAPIIALLARLRADSSYDSVRPEIDQLHRTLGAPLHEPGLLSRALADAERASQALRQMERMALRNQAVRPLLAEVEGLETSTAEMQLLRVAAAYAQRSRNDIDLAAEQSSEIERLLTGTSTADRIGWAESEGTDQARELVGRRLRMWITRENDPRSSPVTQRLARAAVAYYERIDERLAEAGAAEVLFQ